MKKKKTIETKSIELNNRKGVFFYDKKSMSFYERKLGLVSSSRKKFEKKVWQIHNHQLILIHLKHAENVTHVCVKGKSVQINDAISLSIENFRKAKY